MLPAPCQRFLHAVLFAGIPFAQELDFDVGLGRHPFRVLAQPAADTQYQEEGFVEGLRDRWVAPYVSEYTQGGTNLGKNSVSEEERADQRRTISQK
jgi:hypothetical protein